MSPSSSHDSPSVYGNPPSDHAQGPPRKKMRKGTKSCLECRRRKIKCNFEPGRPAVCNECYARGSTCIDQEHGDVHAYSQTGAAESASYSLRERVSQLEDLVRQVLYKLPDKEGPDPSSEASGRTQVDTQAAEVLKSLKQSLPSASDFEESIHVPGGLRESAPALSLFDNAVIARKDSLPEISRSQYNKSRMLVAALHQLLPCPRDLDLILEASSSWFAIWRHMFPEITDHRCETIKESVSHSLRSDSPAEIAKTMLCMAISVHQMPATFDWSRLQLRDDPRELMDRYINAINQLITSDDEIAATVDGIECMVLEAKYHINTGRPRRAWLLFHRAIAFSQLLGLHRLSTRPHESQGAHYKRQVSLWCHLFIGDKYLSLILGLPYLVSEQFCSPYIPPPGAQVDDVSDGEVYAARMCPIVTKIVDRNQSPTPVPYSATLRIDQELDELHDQHDTAWWNVTRLEGSSIEQHFDRLQAQFFHHQVRMLLHMPFMLQSATDKKYRYSHHAALESAREMIRYYKVLREDLEIGPYICKVIDFQAFSAAMLLLLNLCGYAQHARGTVAQQPDLEQDQLDSDLIDTTIAILKTASTEAGGVVAAQSAKALEMLERVRQGCDDAESAAARADPPSHPYKVVIPYFGTITLMVGKHFVPIRKGTYREPGAPRKSMPPQHTIHTTGGLPTPPSLASSSSQASPNVYSSNCAATPASAGPNGARSFSGATTDYPAHAVGGPAYGDLNPFITFDSFMPLPAQEFPPAVFGASTGSSSAGVGALATPLGLTHRAMVNGIGGPPQPAPGGVEGPGSDGLGAFPWTAGDLDGGWNWSGDLQW